jgi:hypothetical protein
MNLSTGFTSDMGEARGEGGIGRMEMVVAGQGAQLLSKGQRERLVC